MYATGTPEVNEMPCSAALNLTFGRIPLPHPNSEVFLKKSRSHHKSSRPAAARGGARPRSPQFGGRGKSAPRRGAAGPSRVLTGIVSANRAGFGFVRSEDLTESIFLPPREMAGLMNGDQVRVNATQGADSRWSGTVIEVVVRDTSAFLATVEVHGRNAGVQSADRRLNLYCTVPPADMNGA